MIRSRRLRIGLLGEFGIGNLGNEGSLEAMLRFLRACAPDAELVCICREPEIAARGHGLRSTHMRVPGPKRGAARLADRLLLGMPARFRNLFHAIARAGELDVLIVPGTGVLDDFGQSPSALPYDLWRWCHAARLAGAKVGFVSVGAGPIYNPLSRLLMKGAARRAHYRSYRDRPSHEFMARIGMRRPLDPLFPDLAFSLPAPPSEPRDPAAPLTVAVGLMSYFGWSASRDKGETVYQAYIAGVTDYVVWLLETGRRVKLVTGDDIDVETAEAVIERVRSRAPERASLLAPFEVPRDLHDVMRQMSAADIVVATRFHNIVCALRIGKPTISLGYAEKNRALLDEVGLSGFCQSVEDFDLELLKAHTERIIAERVRHEAAIVQRVAFFRDRLGLQERVLAEEFLEA